VLGPSHYDLSFSLKGVGISLLGLGLLREALLSRGRSTVGAAPLRGGPFRLPWNSSPRFPVPSP
jgi:hypothetical protein